MHVAEVRDEVEYLKEKIGVQTVTHLNDLGVLDKNFLAVHTVWLTNDEVEMFRDHQVKVSHNPAAAMRVLGFAKVPRMLREGICVTIGTDGAPSNNRMDIVDEMFHAVFTGPFFPGSVKLIDCRDTCQCLIGDAVFQRFFRQIFLRRFYCVYKSTATVGPTASGCQGLFF